VSRGDETPAYDFDGLPPFQLKNEGPSEETGEAIRQAVRADMKPVRPTSVPARVAMVAGAALACGALVVISFGTAGFDGLRRNVIAVIITAVAAVLTALFVGGSLAWRSDGMNSKRGRALLVTTVIAGWSLYVLASITDEALGAALRWAAIGCSFRSVVAGLIGLGAMLWVWRKTDPWSPRISGALMGACAGSIASAGVGIPCPSDQGGHLMLGHWLAVPIVAAIGALVSKRVLAP